VTFFVVARLHVTTGVGVGLLYGYAAALTAGAVAWFAAVRVLRLPAPSAGALICSALVVNTGYLGIPLTATLLGSDQLGAAITYDAVISGPMLYVVGFAVGAAFGTRSGDTGRQRMRAYIVRNPVLVALALALVVPDSLAPDAAVSAAKAVALGLLPVGFFVLGVNLMHEREDGVLDFPPRMSRPLAVALGARLVVAPAVVLIASTLLIRAPDAYLVEAAMPTGINTLLVAHVFGLDLRLTAAAIAWSTAIVITAATIAAIA
jgi:predicted permease